MEQYTTKSIQEIYHYYQYIAYLLEKNASIYPAPRHGDYVTKDIKTPNYE